MKKLFVLGLFLSYMFFGCNDNSFIIGPEEDASLSSLSKNVSQYIIDGSEGGIIEVTKKWENSKSEKKSKLKSVLTIPAGAFEGTMEINIDFDLNNYSIEFGPDGAEFDIPLNLDLSFKNADLSDLDEDSFGFYYVENESEEIEYDSIVLNKRKGNLEVKGAKIRHFSRYGWVRSGP